MKCRHFLELNTLRQPLYYRWHLWVTQCTNLLEQNPKNLLEDNYLHQFFQIQPAVFLLGHLILLSQQIT